MIHNISEVVRQFKQEWTTELDDEAIAEVCREEGMTWRKTILTPIVTIKVFFLQILHGNTACEGLRHLAHGLYGRGVLRGPDADSPLGISEVAGTDGDTHAGSDLR